MQLKSNSDNLPLIILILASLLILSTRKATKTFLVKDSSSSVPLEKIGSRGQYDSSALAKRVTQALQEDAMLKPIFASAVFSIQVAQNESKIILKGTVASPIFFDRMVTVTRNVRGVREIDTSQVELIDVEE